MASGSGMKNQSQAMRWRLLGWGTAALLLCLPLIAMQFTSEVGWDGEDFIFAGVLIGFVGILYELAVRMTKNWSYRGAVVAALAAAFLTFVANGAVGMIGSEENPYNLLFYVVILVALIGAMFARFQAIGMARAMAVASAAQACLSVAGMFSDFRGGALSLAFALAWLLAAALFRKAVQQDTPVT